MNNQRLNEIAGLLLLPLSFIGGVTLAGFGPFWYEWNFVREINPELTGALNSVFYFIIASLVSCFALYMMTHNKHKLSKR